MFGLKNTGGIKPKKNILGWDQVNRAARHHVHGATHNYSVVITRLL